MSNFINRRGFLTKALKAGAVAGLTDLGFLDRFQPGSIAQAKVPPLKMQLGEGVEPLARLIENTPRHKLLDEIALRIRNKLSYEEILTALFLAGVRDIEPRPVGFKFHAVMVINPVRLTSQASQGNDRWLPLFWALDNFKVSQSRNQKEGGWVLKPVNESKLPSASQAKQLFIEGMDQWDEERADHAVTSLSRSIDANELIELFWRFGARDFRDIGHKAIYTANAWRTLECIGQHHLEPVMRSLAYALLDHDEDNPARHNYEVDLPGRENVERAMKIRDGWQNGKLAPNDASDLLAVLRSASAADASQALVEMLNKGVDYSSIWDGLFLGAGELLLRQPGIIGVHCVTSMNALHYGFKASDNDMTRRLLLLQAAAFLPLFRQVMELGKIHPDQHLDTLEKADIDPSNPSVIEQIFSDVSRNTTSAARKTLGFLEAGGDPKALMTAARKLIFSKATDAHDYKFSTAIFEDYYNTTPAWRNRYLASSMFYLRGTGDRDTDVIKRTLAALQR
jgi:hypothetical protein